MEYTIASSLSAIVVLTADWLSGIRLIRRKPFWIFLAVMYAFMIPVNGYLTSRPIVIYAPEHHLGIRVFTMPVEDFLFGFSFMMITLLFWESLKNRSAVRFEEKA